MADVEIPDEDETSEEEEDFSADSDLGDLSEYEEAEETEEEDAPGEDEQDPAPAIERRPPASLQIPALLSPEEREYGEAIFTPQQLAFMESLNARSFAAGQASMAVASAGVEQVLSGATAEYQQMVSPRLQTVISRMTPQQRADPHAADDALAVIIAEEARETGQPFWEVVQRHAQMRGGGTVAPKPRAVIAPKPPAARAPSPSNSGVRPAARPSASSGASSDAKLISAATGMSLSEVIRLGIK
jgi:hypothetical protein